MCVMCTFGSNKEKIKEVSWRIGLNGGYTKKSRGYIVHTVLLLLLYLWRTMCGGNICCCAITEIRLKLV